MPPRRKYTVNDPAFTEYVFSVMQSAPKEKLAELSHKEMSYFKNDTTMYQFANKETLDIRLHLLARLGVSYVIELAQNVEGIGDIMAKVPKQYDKKNRTDICKAMKEGKMFFVSSRDLLLVSHMAAQNSHAQIFVLNYEYSRIKERMAIRGTPSMDMGVGGAISATKEIAGMLLLSMMEESQIIAICGVRKYELRILFCLFIYPNTFVGKNKLAQLLSESARTKTIPKFASVLLKGNYIAREQGVNAESNFNDKVSYTIMEKGINTVMKFVNYVMGQMKNNLQ